MSANGPEDTVAKRRGISHGLTEAIAGAVLTTVFAAVAEARFPERGLGWQAAMGACLACFVVVVADFALKAEGIRTLTSFGGRYLPSAIRLRLRDVPVHVRALAPLACVMLILFLLPQRDTPVPPKDAQPPEQLSSQHSDADPAASDRPGQPVPILSASPSPTLIGSALLTETPFPTATARPSPQLPTLTPSPTPTAVTGRVDLAGRVPTEVPGIPITTGAVVTNVVDRNGPERQVYAISVEAGAVIHARVSANDHLRLDVIYPDQTSARFGRSLDSQTIVGTTESTPGIVTVDKKAPQNGTYYIVVSTLSKGVEYTLEVDTSPPEQ